MKEDKHTAVIYHKADLDGQLSGFIAWLYAEQTGRKVNFFPYDYGEDTSEIMKEALKSKNIYMLDISFEEDDMMRLEESTKNMFAWIDHHQTAMDKFHDRIKYGTRAIGSAGCELAYRWFFGAGMPALVKYVGRYDVWDKSDDRWEHFQYGLRAKNIDITTVQSRILLRRLLELSENADEFQEIIEQGKTIFNNMRESRARIANERSFEISPIIDFRQPHTHSEEGPTGSQYVFVCLNTQNTGSMNLESVYNKDLHDGMIVFGFNGQTKKWKFSMYNDGSGPDLSLIAKYMGGGGHRNACGFECDELPHWLVSEMKG